MSLSDSKLRSIKPRATDFKIADGEGLHLLVKTTGGKLWRLSYRFNRKQKTLALGAYPAVTLLDARQARDQAKRQLAKGLDPSAEKKAKKQERSKCHMKSDREDDQVRSRNVRRSNIPFQERPTCTVMEACDAVGLGKTKFYELLGEGAVETILIGRRRLVRVPSLLRLLGHQMTER